MIDMFGEYASLIKGMASMFANTAIIVNPIILGYFVGDHVSIYKDEFLFILQL